ncbi:hypothetical protein ACSYDW_01330 [Paeniglutamicibacter sp. R2-26]|uniref:hypothetical protein n=1 Tax=Paeniglutamicibacter sp. R2-26 TaxID=3144417 RepID=UPI003EE6A16D
MFPLAHGETVTRLRRTLVEDPVSGQPVAGSWKNPNRLLLEGVAIQPSSSVETVTTTQTQVTTQMSLYCETGADVLPADRIEARSGLWEVTGEIQDHRNGFTGWSPGSEFGLRKVATA